MAVAMGVGTTAVSLSMACSTRPLQGGAVCSSQVSMAAAPLRVGHDRGALPTCRGLKVDLSGMARRKVVPVVRSAQASKGVVCEARDVAVGGTGVVSDQTFQELVLESDVPVLVDFWAPWCGPCRMIAPIIDDLARHYGPKIKCLKLNTDESPYIATEYGIRSIPTVMIFKRGEKMDTVIGAVPQGTLKNTIEKYIDN